MTNFDPDDVLPEQKGAVPTDSEIAGRRRLLRSRTGKLTRLRSMMTLGVAILAAVACYLVFKHAR